MQALFYGIGAAVIAIIAMAAYRLARGTNKRDPLLWGVCAVLALATAVSGAELAALFLLAGLVVLCVRAWPGPTRGAMLVAATLAGAALIWGIERALLTADAGASEQDELLQILLFFTKAGAFVFGSGLAIVPFLQQGVVHDLGWLTEHEFLDAVAVALITPGPVVITVAFIGYLVAGIAGATLAAVGIFLPVYFFTILRALVPAASRERAVARVRRRHDGCGERRDRWRSVRARPPRDLRCADRADCSDRPTPVVATTTTGAAACGSGGRRGTDRVASRERLTEACSGR
jgi:putative chromate ion transporter